MRRLLVIAILFFTTHIFADEHDYEHATEINDLEKGERTELARKADEEFWDLIHGTQNYQNFDTVITKLQAAQIADPFDVYTTAHIGFANFWALSNGIAQPAKAFQYIQNAEQAFSIASAFAPDEPRILGFLGYSRLFLARATQNNDLYVKGLADVNRSVALWPEWAHFGAAYGVDVTAPHNSPAFEQALSHYWDNLDVCANTVVDRSNPDFSPYLVQQTLVGADRACWDSWIAPYNLEGFFLVMGDALVKAGETDIAQIIYYNATLLEHYDSWPFHKLLEERIAKVAQNVKIFRTKGTPGQIQNPESSLVAATGASCAICHQGDADKNYETPVWVGERANDYLVPF
ncbi:MAG: hypothetical protein ACC707_08795 [Thiohalomonadales bacterium]